MEKLTSPMVDQKNSIFLEFLILNSKLEFVSIIPGSFMNTQYLWAHGDEKFGGEHSRAVLPTPVKLLLKDRVHRPPERPCPQTTSDKFRAKTKRGQQRC